MYKPTGYATMKNDLFNSWAVFTGYRLTGLNDYDIKYIACMSYNVIIGYKLIIAYWKIKVFNTGNIVISV